jgi:hypothetical protein
MYPDIFCYNQYELLLFVEFSCAVYTANIIFALHFCWYSETVNATIALDVKNNNVTIIDSVENK